MKATASVPPMAIVLGRQVTMSSVLVTVPWTSSVIVGLPTAAAVAAPAGAADTAANPPSPRARSAAAAITPRRLLSEIFTVVLSSCRETTTQ